MSSQPLLVPVSFPRPFPIVGRLSEQTALRTCLEAAASGQGGLVLISGDAGIGKTTLVEWLGSEAGERGFHVATGQCYDLTMTPPYGPWQDALALLARAEPGSAWGQPLPIALDRTAVSSQSDLFADVSGFLRTVTHAAPLLLVLEDIHWADPASVDLLRFVGRDAGSHGLLLVASYRADELAASQPLAALLPHIVREARPTRIDLSALDDEAVGSVIRDRYALGRDDTGHLVTYLQARSGGNPFYLTEVLRTLEHERFLRRDGDIWRVGALDNAPVPPLVRQMIAERLAREDEVTRHVLDVAAVIGQHIPHDLWRVLSDRDGESFAAAVECGLERHFVTATRDGSGFDFEHALVRETILGLQAHAVRQVLHRRAAEALVSRPGSARNVVAAHFEMGADPRAVDWLIAAGEEALALYATGDAVALFTRAREVAARHALDLPLSAYRSRAKALEILGELDGARRDLELVLDRARNSGDAVTQWHALADLSNLWAARDYDRAGSYSRAALELARSIAAPALIAHGLNLVANWHINVDEPDVALPLHAEALAILEESGDRAGIADTLDHLGMTSYLSCDLLSSTAYYEQAIPLFRELNERQRLATCLAALSLNGGDHDPAIGAVVFREPGFWERCAEESLAITREIGWPSGEAFARFSLSATHAVRGNLGRAFDEAREMHAIAERIGHREWQAAACHQLGTYWLDLLDLDQSQAQLEQGLTIARGSGSRFWAVNHLSTLVVRHVVAGDLALAEAVLQSVLQRDRLRRSAAQRGCWYSWVRLELARGDPERALMLLDELSASTGDGTVEHSKRPILHFVWLRGRALTALSRFDEAERALLQARELARLYTFRPLRWRVDAAIGELYHARGDTGRAGIAALDARETIDEIAGTIPDEAVREPFRARAYRQAGVQPRTPAGVLSPRELDVLRLLVEGKSDREIAEALFISPRTVMRHVTGILTKLAVPSRTAAATVAIRRQLV